MKKVELNISLETFGARKFVFKGECIPKGRPRASRHSVHLRSEDKTRVFEKTIRDYSWVGMTQNRWKVYPKHMALAVDIKIYRRLLKTSKVKIEKMKAGLIRPATTPDLDNQIKSLLDAMNEVVFNDDNQIVDIRAQKFYDDGQGERVEMVFQPLSPVRPGYACPQPPSSERIKP